MNDLRAFGLDGSELGSARLHVLPQAGSPSFHRGPSDSILWRRWTVKAVHLTWWRAVADWSGPPSAAATSGHGTGRSHR